MRNGRKSRNVIRSHAKVLLAATRFMDIRRESYEDCHDINDLSRHKHPLKLLRYIENDCHRKCSRCESSQYGYEVFYYCLLCDLTLCATCTSKPLVVDAPKKIHSHSLTQIMINDLSFICDACGLTGHGFPCVCLQCCFIIHAGCVKLPRVIHINRHDHRVSHTYLLGPGDWICGVCRVEINRLYGCYSCSICRYVVHSKCATRSDVWDGEELEDVPEDENQDLDPFEVISEGLIKHFSHKHELRLVNSGSNDYCYACSLPVYDDPYYTCKQCLFILHETCARFPRKKRHELLQRHLILYPNLKLEDRVFKCDACDRPSTGFTYERDFVYLDVRCAAISEEFLHGSHPHSLFITSILPRVCSACDILGSCVLTCVECSDFFLCFKCATIPNEAMHKYEKHTLYLRYCEDLNGCNWCEICEKPTNPKKWFYSCDKYCSTVHIDCVLGKTPYMKPGHRFIEAGCEYQVVSNNHISRPLCQKCSLRCVDVIVLKFTLETDTYYLCSILCLMMFKCEDEDPEDEDLENEDSENEDSENEK